MKGMFKGILGAVVVVACAAAPAYAADAPAAPLGAQQQKMKDCNADAKTKALTGADRKAFMKTCLSKDGAAAAAAPATAAVSSAKATQQQKMKDCNAEAATKSLKGADRKSFMSTCLKG